MPKVRHTPKEVNYVKNNEQVQRYLLYLMHSQYQTQLRFLQHVPLEYPEKYNKLLEFD